MTRTSTVTRMSAVLLTALTLNACSSQELKSNPRAAQEVVMKQVVDPIVHATIDIPAGWSTESSNGGTLFLCPDTEENWQANIFTELRADDNRPIEGSVATLIDNYRLQHRGFQLVDKVIKKGGASPYATITFKHEEKGSGLSLTDSATLIKTKGHRAVFVLTSCPSSLSKKYQPYFERTIKSVLKGV